jgi:hypothetical protein
MLKSLPPYDFLTLPRRYYRLQEINKLRGLGWSSTTNRTSQISLKLEGQYIKRKSYVTRK